MKGLDTNILLRLLLADEPQQASAAGSFVERHCTAEDPCLANPVVLAEFSWVLRSAYGRDRAEIADALEHIANSDVLRICGVEDISQVIARYRTGRADFSDCLVGALNREAGAAATATFDRKAAELADFEFVPFA